MNLSFNKIVKIEGLTSLILLEFLELGKNEICNAEMLLNPQNHFCLLTELYLYINKIRKLPTLAFPNLRILNLNRNPDLLGLHLGFCPMLEQISVSYCCLQEIGPLKGCPNLLDIDVSFNHLASLKRFLDCLPHRNLTSLSYNDNNFTAITDGEAMYVHNATSTLQQFPE